MDTQEEVAALAGCQGLFGSIELGPSVTDLTPLASLRVIEGRVRGQGDNRDLDTLDGLGRLESVGEFLFLAERLRDLLGVRNLREVNGTFQLLEMPNLTHLDGLERLQSTGDLAVSHNPLLVSIDGLAGLQQVDGDLRIEANPELTGIECLASLERVTADVIIRNNPKVPPAEIEALLSRIEVGGEVYLD